MNTKTEKPNRALLSAIFQRVAKTQEGFAAELQKASGQPVSQQLIQNWLKRENVPSPWVPAIVKASAGKIEAAEIRPDVFGAP